MVVSRQPGGLGLEVRGGEERVIGVRGLEEGLRKLQLAYPVLSADAGGSVRGNDETEGGPEGDGEVDGGQEELGRVFVIGGAEIYRLALGMEACDRVLWTRLGREWGCDVFFPGGVLPKFGEEDTSEDEVRGEGGWVKRSNEEMGRWVGEEGAGGLRREGEVEFEVMMWEKERR